MPDFPSGLDLSGQDLSGADLRYANLSGHDLSGANLGGTDLRRANLRGANLRGADLRGANLSWGNLSGADLGGADLRRANLSGADLSWASVRDTLWPEELVPETISAGIQEPPTYAVVVEGRVYAWDRKTISVPEIRSLGGLPDDRRVVWVELAGGEDYGPVWERALKEDEVYELVPLEPGKGVDKNIEFRRG